MILFCDPRIPPWVAGRCGGFPGGAHADCPSIGEVDAAGALVAGAYLSWVTETNAWAHIAGRFTRAMLRRGLSLVFEGLGLLRLSFLVQDNQPEVLRLLKFLGASPESVIRQGHADGDSLIYVLWRKDVPMTNSTTIVRVVTVTAANPVPPWPVGSKIVYMKNGWARVMSADGKMIGTIEPAGFRDE